MTDLRIMVDAWKCASCSDLGSGYRLMLSVGPNGDVWPVVADSRITEPTWVPCHPEAFGDLAPHEQLGALPPEFQAHIDGLGRPRCGRTRSDGECCRSLVAHPGDACRWHRLAEEEARNR